MSQDSAFFIYDHRDYIRGASILDEMINSVCSGGEDRQKGQLVVDMAKFTHKVGEDGVIYWGEEANVHWENSCGNFRGKLNGEPVQACFVADPSRSIDGRIASRHRLDKVTVSGDFSGGCHLQANSLEDFLIALVDANQQVQLASPPLAGKKWVVEVVFLQKLVLDLAQTTWDLPIMVKNIAMRDHEGRIFTLNSVTPGSNPPLQMGFSFHPKG